MTKDEAEAVDYGCGSCWKCLEGKPSRYGLTFPATNDKMIVCVECGNKRCPKATDHTLACTGSNQPGQTGSRFTARAAIEAMEEQSQ